MIRKKELGQSLLEMLIALAVVLLVVLALVSAVTAAVNSTDFAKKRAQAAALSQEGMEGMRIKKDEGWAAFLSLTNGSTATYGLYTHNSPSGACSGVQKLNVVFSRCVTLEKIADNQVKATVTVSWTDAKGTHKSELVSYFTDW